MPWRWWLYFRFSSPRYPHGSCIRRLLHCHLPSSFRIFARYDGARYHVWPTLLLAPKYCLPATAFLRASFLQPCRQRLYRRRRHAPCLPAPFRRRFDGRCRCLYRRQLERPKLFIDGFDAHWQRLLREYCDRSAIRAKELASACSCLILYRAISYHSAGVTRHQHATYGNKPLYFINLLMSPYLDDLRRSPRSNATPWSNLTFDFAK